MTNYNSTYRLRRLRVLGGFLDGMDFAFADGLNCIIGARGTGKTSTLELIRYALDLSPTDPAQKKHFDSMVANILAGGRIELHVTAANDVDFVIIRTAGEEPMLLNADGSASGHQYNNSHFRLHIFSQNEVENIASNPSYQLPLIDAFQRETLDDLAKEISKACNELQTNAGKQALLSRTINELQEVVSSLPNLEEKLKTFVAKNEDSGMAVAEANDLRALRDRENALVKKLYAILANYGQTIRGLKGVLSSGLNGINLNDFAHSPNYELLQAMYDNLSECGDDADEMLEKLLSYVLKESWNRYEKYKTKLLLAHQEQELQYNELIEKTDADKSVLAERMRLEKERNRLKEKQDELLECQKERSLLLNEQQNIKDYLSSLWDMQFKIRQDIIAKINSALYPRIQLELLQFGDKSIYQRRLSEELKGHTKYYNKVAERIVASLSPAELASYIRDEDELGLQAAAGTTPGQTKDILAAFRGRENALAELETVEQPDLPKIMLNDNGTYKSTDSLSTGQKCNALLPILLMDSDCPLIIDQPEDNLDNGCIHDTIVKSIREVKRKRQLIFATHNPNIPVLGDAEVILVMESNGKNGRAAKQGSIDQCKTEIVNLLEGGKQAFQERMRRYDYYHGGDSQW